uniref:MORN repeat-containing protein n=1 Tax=viral metagenome TaxID=1070528 RepID=A0A6C0BCI1_9ZZZZ
MNFPEQIRRENEVIIVKMDKLIEFHILPTGKVVLSMLGIKNAYKIYNTMKDYPDNVSYVGSINTETYEPDGCGMFNYKNDKSSKYETYAGGVSNGRWYGNGVLTWKNGAIEEGIFDNEMFRGTQTLANGDVIVGEWHNNTLEFVTSADFADGRKLFDTVLHDDFHFVTGKLFIPKCGTFTGTIRKRCFEPYHGTMEYLDGRVYEGSCGYTREFHFICINGCGKMTLPDGTSYSGKWSHNQIVYETPGTLSIDGTEVSGLPLRLREMNKYMMCDAFSGWNHPVKEEQEQEEQEEKNEVCNQDCPSDCDCLYCKEMPRTFTVAEDNDPRNLKLTCSNW